MMPGAAVFAGQHGGDAAVELPEGGAQQVEVPLFFMSVDLLLLQAQGFGGHPAETAEDQPGDDQEAKDGGHATAKPAFHDLTFLGDSGLCPFVALAARGTRSGPAM